jgi:coenzyme F420-dependent glucose-6-phosphate dehydrogenase
MTEYWFAASTEEFRPSALLEQARAADRASFDAIGCTDHFAPWFPDGEGAAAWSVLPAIAQHTELPLFTSVTPIQHHYHPAVVAQWAMSLQELHDEDVILGVGSGEALNEAPLGLDWPSPSGKLARFERGLEAIRRLWAGETVTMDGGWFALRDARLHTLATRRPRLIVSAFGPQAAAIAARRGDGLWTLGDPEQAPKVISAYREACERHGRAPGDIVLQAPFCLGAPEEAIRRATRRWKPTRFPENYIEDRHDLEAMAADAERRLSDERFAREGAIVAVDPAEHVRRIRELASIDGVTVVCLQAIGALDPCGAIRRYGEDVLPVLRGTRRAHEGRFDRAAGRAV